MRDLFLTNIKRFITELQTSDGTVFFAATIF